METAEIHCNHLTHQLHASNSQKEALQKCLDDNTVKYQMDHQLTGTIVQSLQERHQRLETCHVKEVLNVEVAQKKAIKLREELSMQKNSYSPEILKQLQKVTESEQIAREGQNSLR